MSARIYKPAQNVMQQGKGSTRDWVLEFVPDHARHIEPLMGWTSSTDTKRQVRLNFASKDEAIAYAKENGIAFRVPGAVIAGKKGNLVHFGVRIFQPVKEGRSVERPGGGCLVEVGVLRREVSVIATRGVENHIIFVRYSYTGQPWIGTCLVHEVHMILMDELQG